MVIMEFYEYKTVQQIATSDRYPFTLGQLRHLFLFRHRNGLDEATRKIGKRLLIRVDLFDKWIESHQNGGTA